MVCVLVYSKWFISLLKENYNFYKFELFLNDIGLK